MDQQKSQPIMKVTAHKDVSTAKGRKIIQELEKHKNIVKIDHTLTLFINSSSK